MNPDVVD